MGLAHGIVGWTDVAVPDIEAGTSFYSSMFGWEAISAGPSDSMQYTMFTLDGKLVAGMGPLSQEQIDAGQPPVWSSYIIVDDADAVFAAAVELGATPLMEPMQIMDTGKMAFVLDPAGAAVGFWQSGTHDGAEVFNVPGSLTWNDLAARDVEAAKTFYTTLLGWDVGEMPMGDDGTYWTFSNQGRMNGGTWDMSGMLPDDVPPHWMAWFLVSNCQASADQVEALGGVVLRPPSPTGVGISAVVTDPFGAMFGIIETDQAEGQPPR
ncbi:MAG: VOC family protein [Acidimicrobiia bacterium]